MSSDVFRAIRTDNESHLPRQSAASGPSESPRVLLVKSSPNLAERLRALAPRAEIVAVASAADGETHIDDVDVVVMADRVRPAYLTSPRLRWMHIIGAGVDGFSIPGLQDASFVITHKVNASIIPMAEHVIAQILVIARRALEYRALQARHQWAPHNQPPTTELIQVHGKTLGLVGLGGAGLATARRAKAFGMRVVGTKRAPADRLPHVDEIFPATRLHDMLARSDFVAVTAPLTDQTHRLIGEPELRAMKPTAYLINVSRGPIIQEDVLTRALRECWIAGASLDVFEREPLDPTSPLWEMPNVIVTPHCGGVGPYLAAESVDEVVDNFRRFVAGRPLRYQLNRDDIVTSFDPPSH